jgi:hypothetical protein
MDGSGAREVALRVLWIERELLFKGSYFCIWTKFDGLTHSLNDLFLH